MPAWARELTSGELCGYAWMDTERVCGALRNGIAVYELSLMLKRSSSSRRARARVRPVKAALAYVEPVGEAVLRLEMNDGTPRGSLKVVAAGPGQR